MLAILLSFPSTEECPQSGPSRRFISNCVSWKKKWMPRCAARSSIGSISSDWVKKVWSFGSYFLFQWQAPYTSYRDACFSHVSVQILESLVSVGAYLILFIPYGSTANFICSFHFIPFSELPEKKPRRLETFCKSRNWTQAFLPCKQPFLALERPLAGSYEKLTCQTWKVGDHQPPQPSFTRSFALRKYITALEDYFVIPGPVWSEKSPEVVQYFHFLAQRLHSPSEINPFFSFSNVLIFLVIVPRH